MRLGTIVLAYLVSALFLNRANAADTCSLNLAKKFADGVIAVEVKENKYGPGQVVFKRSLSKEYTQEYLDEQIRLIGEEDAQKYVEMKKELQANKSLHIYRLQYTYEAENNLDLGFYYFARLTAYPSSPGCSLESLIAD